MEIVEVSSQEYCRTFHDTNHVYNSPEFNELNRCRTNEVKYLFFIRNKLRLGLIAGIKEQLLMSPFSAPFGGFSALKPDIGLSDILLSAKALNEYGRMLSLVEIRITLPPQFYDYSTIAKYINALFAAGYETNNIDLNYHFDLSVFDKNYPDILWKSARKNLRIALKQGMVFRECGCGEDKKVAYDVIKSNRRAKGYPLRMSYDQIIETGKVVDSYFFLVV